MLLPIHLSSSPPNEWDGNPEEAAYYCSIMEAEGWRNYELVRGLVDTVAVNAVRSAIAGYTVTMAGNKEVGIVVAFEDARDGLVYLGIDQAGRTCVEPGVNEAVWTILNAARGLANGHRLAGGPATT